MDKLLIATGKSRFETKWKNVEVSWPQLVEKLSKTYTTRETMADYAKMKKSDQDQIKDIGGFVGGHLKEGKRRNGQVVYRTLVTLDADFALPAFWDNLTVMHGYRCLVYSTHKHSPAKPRLRLIIPLSRKVNAEEYEAIARRLAYELGIDQFDDTTYQATRLMYWPSTSSDGEYFYQVQDGEVVDADKVLAKYEDWKDVSYWPMSSRVQNLHTTLAKKQEDPLTKPGPIGAFCRTYDIHTAIETYLADIYTRCAGTDRYTYINGSTSAGMITYDDKFAYSNHATDPSSMQLCNAFDLVRIHKFFDLDESAGAETPTNKLPSFVAMTDLCYNDENVRLTLGEERLQSASEDFGGIQIPEETDWLKKLEHSKRGEIEPTIDNMLVILRNDPNLAGLGGFNEFNYRSETSGALPWNDSEDTRSWSDTDDAGIRHYIEKVYKVSVTNKLNDALALRFEENKFHPVRTYLEPLKWDKKERLDTLLIDYLGADDSPYTRAVTRKAFTAAVARVYHPGIKFDYMVTLTGAQGIGKSTLVKKMAKEWYSDSLISIGTKDAYESLQGIWLVEMAELTATKKAEVEAVKQFISKQEDTYRMAYARRSTIQKRQCVFFGTTNNAEFLRDMTGNRRFWPVDTTREYIVKSVFEDLTEATIDQLWAEAKHRWKSGEPLYLGEKLEEEAMKRQEAHSEYNPKQGLIEGYLDMLLPENWNEMSIPERQVYIHGDEFTAKKTGTKQRQTVCAIEIWRELFQGDTKAFNQIQTREINDILRKLVGWKEVKTIRFEHYDIQRGFRRIV